MNCKFLYKYKDANNQEIIGLNLASGVEGRAESWLGPLSSGTELERTPYT